MARYRIAQLSDLDTIACPCGTTRRAFTDDADGLATVHLLDVYGTAKTHYHKRLTEIYVILEGEGEMELDGERVGVKPLTAVIVKPGCRHRAVGTMRILIVVTPKFDPQDEWLPDGTPAEK